MNVRKTLAFCLLASTVILTGCQSQQMYNWGGYEDGLYSYYQSPEEFSAFMEELSATIERGERDARVAPGLYAKYGNLLLQQGNTGEAIEYFKKERDLWPESQKFMDSLITNLSKRQSTEPTES